MRFMKYISMTIVGLIIIFGIVGSLIKTTPIAPPKARMIVDHTLQVYVAPPCFNEADVTNYLEETTFERAVDLGYTPESSCTEEAIIGEPRSLLDGVLQNLGLKQGQWSKNGEWNY